MVVGGYAKKAISDADVIEIPDVGLKGACRGKTKDFEFKTTRPASHFAR